MRKRDKDRRRYRNRYTQIKEFYSTVYQLDHPRPKPLCLNCYKGDHEHCEPNLTHGVCGCDCEVARKIKSGIIEIQEEAKRSKRPIPSLQETLRLIETQRKE